jgi:hypothetical protein
MNRVAIWLASAAVVLMGQPALAQSEPIAKFELTVQGDNPVLLCVPLSIQEEFARLTDVTIHGGGTTSGFIGRAQLTSPSLLTEKIAPSAKGLVRRDLHLWVSGKQGAMMIIAVMAKPLPKVGKTFVWKSKEKDSDWAELERGGIPVLRYMHKAYDNSTPENRDKTYKVFHHLYDPSGQRFVTNGGDTNEKLPQNPKDLLYPHHRGLMFAFNKITYDDKKSCDTWHAKPGDTHESHEGFLATEAGSELGRHRVAVSWHGPKNEVFAKEERELTVYRADKGTLVEFASRLKTTGGKVKLDGDPQHAGFQFRAHNDVHEQKNDKQTYYLRPDGKGKLGDTRNWDPKKGGPVNLPWDAMSFVLDGKRYTVVYLNHPSNPKESRWSERDYGRFGCYFEYEVTEQNPLVVNYRVWLQEGEMTLAECEALYQAFASPPKVTMN